MKPIDRNNGSDELINILETMVSSKTIRSFEDLDSALYEKGYAIEGRGGKEFSVKDSAMKGYWIYCSKQMLSPVNMVGSLYRFQFNNEYIIPDGDWKYLGDDRDNLRDEERFPYTLIAIDYLYRGGELKNERIWELGDEWKESGGKGMRILNELWYNGEDSVMDVMGKYKIYVFTSSEFIKLFFPRIRMMNWVANDPLKLNKN